MAGLAADRIRPDLLAEWAEDQIPRDLLAGSAEDRIPQGPLAESAGAATAVGCCDRVTQS